MARYIWTGSISFGLVNIPVRMHSLVREQRASFHLLHDADNARLQRKLMCSEEEKEVHSEHIIRGYEVSEGRFVTISDAELEALEPEATRAIEITRFVDAEEVPPIYFDRAYYLSPGEGALKAYVLLLNAMQENNRVGLARFVMHDREHVACLRPMENVIALSTLHFADEVLPVDEIVPSQEVSVAKGPTSAELKMAVDLISSMSTKFDPKQYHDEHRKRVAAMLKKKTEGEEIVAEPAIEEEEEKTSGKKTVSLLRALEKSLAESRQARGKTSQSKSGGKKGTKRRKAKV